MLILGIVLTLTVPRLPDLDGARHEAATRRLATLASYLRDEAALRGRVYRLELDLDDERYAVTQWSPYAPAPATLDDDDGAGRARFERRWDPHAEPTRLAPPLDLAAVETAGVRWTTGVRHLYFLPEGLADGFRITVADGDGAAASVTAAAGTGRIRVDQTEDES